MLVTGLLPMFVQAVRKNVACELGRGAVAQQKQYCLRSIIHFANIVSRHILMVDIFVLAKSNMDQRE
jgi:hypothetical protein